MGRQFSGLFWMIESKNMIFAQNDPGARFQRDRMVQFSSIYKTNGPGFRQKFHHARTRNGKKNHIILCYFVLVSSQQVFSTFLAFLALKLSLSGQVTTIYVYWDSSMPFASINPIFVEINLWKFLSENHYSYSPNHQITI